MLASVQRQGTKIFKFEGMRIKIAMETLEAQKERNEHSKLDSKESYCFYHTSIQAIRLSANTFQSSKTETFTASKKPHLPNIWLKDSTHNFLLIISITEPMNSETALPSRNSIWSHLRIRFLFFWSTCSHSGTRIDEIWDHLPLLACPLQSYNERRVSMSSRADWRNCLVTNTAAVLPGKGLTDSGHTISNEAALYTFSSSFINRNIAFW